MKKLTTTLLFLIPFFSFSQTILTANGVDDTYDLINSILAPNHNAIEVPDCGHTSFGEHIDQVYDNDLGQYVFRFHIHTASDNDRCRNYDRQRNEIKTYNQSPDNLLGVESETVQYNWKFKLDANFQPSYSFTHLHQIKAVGGSEASMPLITLTARKGNPDKLELRYAENSNQTTLQRIDLNPLKGEWIEVTETILYGETGIGKYEILIENLATTETLLYYRNDDIRTWKTNADFIRPKWGIYRSLNDSGNLNDEIVLFADFSIEELSENLSLSNHNIEDNNLFIYPNPSKNKFFITDQAINNYDSFYIYDGHGQLVLKGKVNQKRIITTGLDTGFYILKLVKLDFETKSIKLILN